VSASPQAASLWRAPLLVFLLSLAVNGLLAYWLARGLIETDRAAFETDALRTMDAIRERVSTTVTLLRGAAGLFIASDEVNRNEFRAYTARLRLRENYPGIQGLGYTARVDAADLPAFEKRMQRLWGAWFRVWPNDPRETYHSITYLEPLDERNLAAIGFDMFSEPTRRAAMAAARDAGLARASGRVTLVQEIDQHKQAGFLIYLPLYRTRITPLSLDDRRRELMGFVYSPLRVDDLLAGTRGSGVRQIDYDVYDSETADPATLLRSTRRGLESHDPRFTMERMIDVEGRRWLLRFASSPEFDALSQQRFVPALILIALATSLLLARITWVQTRARREALRAAAERRLREDRERRRGERLQQLAQATPRLNAARALDAVILTLEAEARHLFNSPEARLCFDTQEAPEGGLCAPLAGEDGRPLGTLVIAPRGGAGGIGEPADDYGDDDRLLLRQFAGIAAIALRNARLYGELRDNDRRKDEFLATLAHELRNPLAPIRTSLEIIRQAPDSPQANKARDVAERQTVHMVRLIDDLLDISRITRGTIVLQREPVRVAQALEAAVETSMPHLRARGHRLLMGPVDPSLVVTGDPARLAQIFSNLLNNAANYTEPGGEVRISVERERSTVHVTVSDTGIGIDPQLLPRIFDMFMQANRSRERGGGLGLGLTLVRQLVEMHGGTISADSEGPGRGSRFRVCLPLAEPTAAPNAAPELHAPTSPRAPRRLLVVDDNVDAADSLAVLLRIDGHEVRIAHDGRSALEAVEDFRPDALLLDIGLPDLSGHEVARRVGALPLSPRPRLIAISGWGQQDDRQQAREAGFDLHMVKPVDHAALVAHLQRLLGS
jgi:signal transduction histidine kinase/CHASE1-domain containing sensor protein